MSSRNHCVDVIGLKLLLKLLFLFEQLSGELCLILLRFEYLLLLFHLLFQLGLSLERKKILSALPDVLSKHFFNCCFYQSYKDLQKIIQYQLSWQKDYQMNFLFTVFFQQTQPNFQQYPKLKMNSFKGLIPKNLTSDQALGVLTKRTQEFRRMTHQSSDIASSILKIYEAYLLQLPRIMGLLFEDEVVGSQSFESCLRSTYLEIYKQYQNFTLDHIQTPTNQITNSNSSRFISFSGSILSFQKLMRNYCNFQSVAWETSKKYFKSQKALVSSIQAYKESFTEAKLIYNIDEKIKRYSVCELNYKNVALDHGMVTEARQKLEEKKKQVRQLFQCLIKQDSTHQNEVDLKIFSFLSKFNVNICQSLKRRLNFSKEGRKHIEKTKILSFFENFKLEEGQFQANQQSIEGRGRRKAGNITMLNKIDNQNGQQLKRIYAKIEKFVEVKKNEHLKLYDFHLEFYKTAEKKSVTQLKQALQNLQKNQKKIKQQFCRQVYEELKNTQIIIRSTSEIYNEFQKKIASRIQSAGEIIEELKNTIRTLLFQVNNIIEKTAELRQLNQVQNYKEKVHNIQQIIKSYDAKFITIFSNIRTVYTQILNIYEIGLTESYEKCYQIGKSSCNSYEETISAIKLAKPEKLKNSILGDLLNEENAGKITFEDQSEKNNDFKKLKKPVEIEILDKQKELAPIDRQKQELEKFQCLNDAAEDKLESSPSKKRKKHMDFIQSKVSFVEGEQFKSAYSCALADKIILQGRLFVTTHRVCFFSNFNPSNVFFGQTFIQIPKKDILTLEKRKNGIFFDNSISITTVKGQVFLTSFFKRNEAFTLISQIIGVNREDQAYEQDPNVIQSDSSSVVQKISHPRIADKVKEEQLNEPILEAEDDIKQSQITERAQSIKKLMDQLTYPFKQSASAEYKIAGLTAYKLLQVLILEGQVTISGKTYLNVTEYFKKVVQLHKDIQISSFTPPIQQFLNPNNIKSTCPLKLNGKISATVPTPNSGIPFVPKFTKATEKQTLYIISKHRWVLDNEVESSGAPYTDSFRVYYRTICDSTPQSTKLCTSMYIHFIKNVMVKGIIQTKTGQQSALQFKKQYEELRKYLMAVQKQKQKRIKLQSTPELVSHQSCPEKLQIQRKEEPGEQENERIKQLEVLIAEIRQKHEKVQKQLKKSISKYQTISFGLAILCLILLLGLGF